MTFKKLLPFILGTFISTSAIASDFNDGIDKIFSSVVNQNTPGCNVGVIKDGAFIHKTGYGLANLELDVPLNGNQVHRMASVSKQFTAMAVLLLAEEEKIDLDADIRTYLTDLKEYNEVITVRSMLGHYSGMGDYDLIAGSYEGDKAKGSIDLKSVAGGDFRLGNEDYLTISEFYSVVKTVPLALKPNQKFQYSNLAYFLLSMLVEEVSGKSLRDYSDDKIFRPLGMTSTFFSDDPVEIVKNRAVGYNKNNIGNYITDMTNLFWVGDGGLHTNLDDLLKWDQNFYAPKVGKNPEKLIELMNMQNSSHNSDSFTYANGQFVGEILERKSYGHSGGWLGTSTYYVRFPDEKFSLALMCNDVSLETSNIRDDIFKLYFNRK
jgi:CubicO group peptidase (beta-lactamase class C family)